MRHTQSEYLFGDTLLAAKRLELFDDIFASTSRSFLRERRPSAPLSSRIAVDVGCGIGRTTELVRQTGGSSVTVGIDSSATFLGIAAPRHPACHFVRADAACGLVVRGAALIYARYVLLHLRQPRSVLAAWCPALVPGGRLLLEENINYATGNPVLRDYMETAAVVMEANGQDLYLGRQLRGWDAPPGYRVVHAERVDVTVPAARAATLFSMNFPSWREGARAHRSQAWLEELARRMQEESKEGRPGAPITWNLLQFAIERDSAPWRSRRVSGKKNAGQLARRQKTGTRYRGAQNTPLCPDDRGDRVR